MKENIRFNKFLPYFFVFGLFLLSIIIRLAKFDSQQNVANLDASYHVLSTVKAMMVNPISIHKFLPIVTYGEIYDKYIPWGATVPDNQGNYFYTSFPVIGFIVPYIYFKITSFPLSLKNLMIFNFIIHFIATLLLCKFLQLSLKITNISRQLQNLILVMGAATYIFTYEALYSHGIVYWGHSLFQVIWLIQLIFLVDLLYKQTEIKKWKTCLFLVVCILIPLTEWTGYLVNGSIFVVLLLKPKYRRLSLGVFFATIVSGFLHIGHFLLAINSQYLFNSLKSRFFGRSSVNSDTNSMSSLGLKLLHGYWESFGMLFILLLLVVASFLIIKYKKRNDNNNLNLIFIDILFVLCFPLLENIIMIQHAVEYNYDRLKMIIPIIFVISVLIPMFNKNLRQILFFFWVIAIVSNVWAFYNIERESIYFNHKESNIQKYIDSDQELIKLVQERTKPDAVYSINGGVRGWVNLTLNRSVYERVVDLSQLKTLVQQRKVTQGVWLIGDDLGNQIFEWKTALIYDANTDSKKYITTNGSFNVDDVPFPITNDLWINGIGRSSASFIVINSNNTEDKFKPGVILNFINGEKRIIQKVDAQGTFIIVDVQGEPLDWRTLGFPSKLGVEAQK